jgi:RNA polymerase sigma-70 factor (ECF subfamily)
LAPEPERDEVLLARFLAGDEGSFTKLMKRHEDSVFKIALRMTSNRADALDATQDAFVTVFRRAHSFRGDAAFSTWLYRIAINACHDLLRKRARSVPARNIDETGSVRSPEDASTAQIDVARALAELPEEYRIAVVLHDIGGATHAEIAASLDIAVGTVKSRISRGRRALAAILEPQGVGPASNPEDGHQ